MGLALLTLSWGSLSVPLTATTTPPPHPPTPRRPVARLLPHPYLWLVGFPESRRSLGAEDLARHAAHHCRQPILTGDVLHGVPRHLWAQLAAGDVGLRARAVHGEPPVARLLPGRKHSAEGRTGQVTGGPGTHPSFLLHPGIGQLPGPAAVLATGNSLGVLVGTVSAPGAQPASRKGIRTARLRAPRTPALHWAPGGRTWDGTWPPAPQAARRLGTDSV